MEKNKELKPNRCAIYTRKSTSEGLDQEFTSLDAQRESAESYIASQKHLGWIALPDKYDDGGFTGATMDRPALQKLLEDIKAKKADCVIVYKVDRLSRSLLDFVKLLQFFEEQQITFVSVTQHFNTNTSMGRLTLNILLSFAQFEREMISERTKDKMAAARMKGRWIGGRAGLGYDIDSASKKLVINPKDAELVRLIFSLYIEKKSLLEVARVLNERGYLTKAHKDKHKILGGVTFKNTNVQMVLNNVVYMGKVKYDGKVYPGLHEPIISEEIFNQARAILKQNVRERGVSKNRKFPGLLSGIFRCAACETSMSHSYARKNKYKYRYYICLNAIKLNRQTCPTKSISAAAIEEKCLELLMRITKDKRFEDSNWKTLPLEKQMAVINELVREIDYDGGKSKLRIYLKGDVRKYEYDLPIDELKKRIPASSQPDFKSEPVIKQQLLLAHQIQQMLDSGRAKDLKQISEWTGMSKARLQQIMNLLFLCPRIQEDILTLEQASLAKISEYNVRSINQEIDWAKQTSLWQSILA
ncbi:MAG TPA: recombinase family protein [Candidatus Omnitrophota bacterium]|nr:recombinase family protein [Candidatus Omnitrophota bacterium]